MNNTIYKQGDSRWASLPYPKGSTVGGCGCGLVSCVHIAIEQKDKAKWTPRTLRPWMVRQGFAIRGQGTTWEGITKTLQHIGHKNVFRIYKTDSMDKAFKELNKGNRIGIILFNGNVAPNGKQWTVPNGGHYVAFNRYYIGKKTGRHYFHTKDSGWRNHSGNYSYERSMKGCIEQMWIVERIDERTWADKSWDWAKKISKDDFYHYVAWSKDKRSHECPICHKHPKGAYHGWNCIGFAYASWHHGAGFKSKCNCGVISNEVYERILFTDSKEKAEKIASEHIGIPVTVIRNRNGIPKSKFKKGDICALFSGNKYVHTWLCGQNGWIADSSRGYSNTIGVRKKFNSYAKSTKLIIRPKER